MVLITRRELLASSVAISASSLLERSLWARDMNSILDRKLVSAADSVTAIAPREQLLFDFGWKFKFGHGTDPSKDLEFGYGQADFSKTGEFKFAKAEFNDSDWVPVRLPHDWAVALPSVHDDSGTGDSQLRSHGYKPLGRRYPETSVGWYRREFETPASDAGRRIWVEFDGAFRDVLVFVNGCFVGRSNNGYIPFRFDLTDFLAYGAKNYIVLRVDASFGDGWFYEGAGVYRHVWLLKTHAVHLSRWESVVRSTVDGRPATLHLSTIVENEHNEPQKAKVKWSIVDARGVAVATAEALEQSINPDGSATFQASAKLSNPALWSVDAPNLYSAIVTVETEGSVCDGERVSFGVRSLAFDPEKGFFLNGESLKIQGTCNHQDHAGVGAALPDRLQWFRLAVLREMGSNAVRTAHNMPTPEWVEACDRMGMMLMCEARQTSSSAEGLGQLEVMIKRYRNSPSVIIWSIGNEENQLQGPMAEQGAKIAATMVRKCHELDPTRVVTAAVNADNRRGISDAVDVVGFNYHLDFPDAFHKDNPKRPVFGSETSSAVSTRGEYTNDSKRNVVDSYHGVYELPELWWKFYGERDWTAGGFAWTGFDYRGEPTPYGWPSVSSNFGIVDLCGFPKDYFYYYKAWWRPEPSLHLFPHWNWTGREGTDIPVWVYSNLDEVELLVNGKSAGKQKVPHLSHLEWKVKYEPGVIEARGSRDGKVVMIERRETTGAPHSIRLTADRTEMNADGEDLAVLKIEILDRQGRPVPTADNKIVLKVSGEGTLIGVGNGDPNCQESDKEPRRSVFNGLAQAIVQSTMEPGNIRVEVVKEEMDGPGLIPASLIIATKQVRLRPTIPVVPRG
ncbi:beta-galactosidase GalA [Terriglobus saanensis]|uniref:Glycoside hydrolase family 2 sugar binding protein n=1 Tax=Terriglobus saanensis (strain ATCC BAA-1853 / DSM 23119 / SP1PR4) TaxID=401053 RepID=E8V1U7_TERSS|nr:beta-galactosidase GalA [Terriglobus saanensis]ADV83435.1 glycoside hydrolase family 2 sugar binding protein [Terriglobus saanensis SP1PR4]